jgi:hypothetical protein
LLRQVLRWWRTGEQKGETMACPDLAAQEQPWPWPERSVENIDERRYHAIRVELK